MKTYNIIIHDDFGSITFDKDFKARNASEAMREFLKFVNIEAGDIIRVTLAEADAD